MPSRASSRRSRVAATISFLACLPGTFATADAANGNNLKPRTNEGAFILQGLGMTQEVSQTSSTASAALTTPTLPSNERVGAAQDTGLLSASSASSSRDSSGSFGAVSVPTTTTTSSSSSRYRYTLQKPTFTVPANGSGLSYAAACISESIAYKTYSDFVTGQLGSYTVSSVFHYNFTASYTTLCDGSARVAGTLTPTATITITTSQFAPATYNGPSPSCTVASSYCAPLCESYDSAFSHYLTLASATVALPATPTVITVGNPVLGTNTTTIATAPITAWPTLSLFGTTYPPKVSSGTPFWSLGFYSQNLAPGGTVTVGIRPNVTPPPGCYVFGGGACEEYVVSSRLKNPSGSCTTMDQCTVYAQSVQLIHFPITTTVSKNFCDTTGRNNVSIVCPGGVRVGPSGTFDPTTCSYPPLTTASEADSGPYAVYSGKTFYQNRVYLSIAGVGAWAPCRGMVGTTISDELLTLYTSELYSVCQANKYQASAIPYNLGDLEAPIAASAYACQPNCDYLESQRKGIGLPLNVSYIHAGSGVYSAYPAARGWCGNIIVDELFRPRLAVPLQVRALDPLWATCALDLAGIYDPPIVLTAEATAAPATLPTFLPTTTAAAAPGIPQPASATFKIPAPTSTSTSSQRLPEFTFDPQSDNVPSTATSAVPQGTATVPLTISAIIIPQGPQLSNPTSPALAAPPVSAASSLSTNGNLGTTTNAPAAVASGSGQSPYSSITAFAIGSQTASAGGPAVTAGGTTFSALPSGSGVQVIVGGLTSTINLAAPGATATSFPSANIHIGTQTLSAGGPAITQSGTTYTLLPSGSGVKINAAGYTSTLSPGVLAIAPPSASTTDKSSAANTTLPNTTSGSTLHPIGPISQPAWTIGGNHVITEGQAWTANGTIFSDISGTLYTGSAPPATTTATTSALTGVIKQGAAAAVRIREISWSAGAAVGVCLLSGVLAVVL